MLTRCLLQVLLMFVAPGEGLFGERHLPDDGVAGLLPVLRVMGGQRLSASYVAAGGTKAKRAFRTALLAQCRSWLHAFHDLVDMAALGLQHRHRQSPFQGLCPALEFPLLL